MKSQQTVSIGLIDWPKMAMRTQEEANCPTPDTIAPGPREPGMLTLKMMLMLLLMLMLMGNCSAPTWPI